MTETLFAAQAACHVQGVPPVSSLEVDFPASALSSIGLKESWRKEVHRPATSTHKWWAKRLGTVFRGIITSAAAVDADQALRFYSSRTSLSGMTILDPFGGSGTTAVEAVKLGARAVSFDINPVATLVQRQALQAWDEEVLHRAFSAVEKACRHEIDRVHRTEEGFTVLYYFWVAVAECGTCSEAVRLFDSPIFSRNAYPKRVPRVQLVCPVCSDIKEGRYDFEFATCRNGHEFGRKGAVSGALMTCSQGHRSKIKEALRGNPPHYEMYAKMVWDGHAKSYQPITDWDRALYKECEELLKRLPANSILPRGSLEKGHNTSQAIGWNFTEWRNFFNARQLYSLSILASAVSDCVPSGPEREALCALFSGTLEFNNMFCSFKGEGTGAVRHMFSHHILKPERAPLEAHPWGTPQSSGSFSTLFKSRLGAAHSYKADPADLVEREGEVVRVRGISRPLNTRISTSFDSFAMDDLSDAYVATCNAARTDLPDASVDLVITDPPYMDNVHYAELADFFHAWLSEMRPYDEYPTGPTTRTVGEVQHAEAKEFGLAIAAVWSECARALKPEGLVAFTFHQARISGWIELVRSLRSAGLRITAIQPVKGEMTTSVTKSGAKEPSNLDSVVVCRKAAQTTGAAPSLSNEYERSYALLSGLIAEGVDVGAGDIRSVMRGSLLAALSFESDDLESQAAMVDSMADEAITRLLEPHIS
jgi:putative DNA methylase